MPKSLDQLKKWLPQCGEADLVEIRLDYLPTLNLKSIRAMVDKPLIATLRSLQEKGFWEKDISTAVKVYRQASKAGMDYLDVELSFAEEVLPKLKQSSAKLILSHHSDSANFPQLKSILDQMRQYPADIYKLVIKADSLHDNLAALKLTELAQSLGLNYIIHAMGAPGQVSRMFGALQGNAWTYVSGEFAEETAPGQLALHEAKNYYYLTEKSSATKILGLVGSPIQQSKGWRLHNKLIAQNFPGKGDAASVSTKSKEFLYVNFSIPAHFSRVNNFSHQPKLYRPINILRITGKYLQFYWLLSFFRIISPFSSSRISGTAPGVMQSMVKPVSPSITVF